jgi:hypothetical protein
MILAKSPFHHLAMLASAFLSPACILLLAALTIEPLRASSISLDPEVVIKKYGVPDQIDTTEFDNPRPPMLSKILVYRKENVQFLFMSSALRGQASPVKWMLVGASDPRDDSLLEVDEMEERMRGRLHRQSPD